MKVLVLGGGGFLGRSVVRQLLEQPDVQVTIGSRHAAGAKVGQGVSVATLDTRDLSALQRYAAKADVVINCVTGDGATISDGAKVLVDAALAAGKPRLIHLSTMSIYGSRQGVLDESTPPLDDIGWYGHAKIQAEAEMTRYAKAGGVVILLRPGVIIGPGSDPWVRRLARWLCNGRLADLGPSGDGPANLVDVEDVAQAVVRSTVYRTQPGDQAHAFNLVAPDSPRWNDYFRDLSLALGAAPLQRWGQRRLKAEIMMRGLPLKVLERLGQKLGLNTREWPEGIPPSLAGLWTQQIQLECMRATTELGVEWTPYTQTLQQSAEWAAQSA
jgi:nucleoside-diphosphate-sugar epimerase